jgi:hypothetical protein
MHEGQAYRYRRVLFVLGAHIQHRDHLGDRRFPVFPDAGAALRQRRVGFLPLVLSVPPIMIWLAASIFVYASVAHHPDPRVVQYNRWAGYRFYGATGLLVVLGQPLYSLLEGAKGLLLNWAIMALIVVPWAAWDIVRAGRESWQDLVVEVSVNE